MMIWEDLGVFLCLLRNTTITTCVILQKAVSETYEIPPETAEGGASRGGGQALLVPC